eukprot:INCI3115.1.p1 GENE.INCI3115.1~~INCI3115.1.p1  ORF type:complete len:265 (-),score=31.01 INCI3115.1:166-960(-)
MKLSALIFAAAGVATGLANPAPFPSPAPADPPAPGAYHHAPAPRGEYSNVFGSYDSSSSSKEMQCTAAFNNACRGTVGKDCSQCVTDNAMALVALGCDTIQLISKSCPVARRNLRRNLVELAALPSPYPSPAPNDPPAPEHERIAPSPRFDYGPVMWSPAPVGDQPAVPANIKACDSIKVGASCSYTDSNGAVVTGSCTAEGNTAACVQVDNTVSCNELFLDNCGQFAGKACADCVISHGDDFEGANCEPMKIISGSCFPANSR